MPLTTEHFWFEELKRVKDLPVGDPEILTKYVGGKGQPDNTYFLVRRLPVDLSQEPAGVFYFYQYDPANGGSIWMCADFIAGAANMRDAAISLVDRCLESGLKLDDGTVLLPKIKDFFAALPVLERNLPQSIRERSRKDLEARPEKARAVLAAISASTWIADQMDNSLIATSFDVAVIDREKGDEDELGNVTFRWRRAG